MGERTSRAVGGWLAGLALGLTACGGGGGVAHARTHIGPSGTYVFFQHSVVSDILIRIRVVDLP